MTLRASRMDAALVLVATALVALWWLVPRGTIEDPLRIADWSDLAEGASGDLDVRRGSEKVTIHVERESPTGRHYLVKDQVQVATDPAALDRLIHALGHLQALRPIDGTRSQLGLDQPSIELRFSVRSESRAILIGAAAPTPIGAHYAEIVRDARHQFIVLGPNSAQLLDVQPESLLDHRVLDWLPSELQRIESSDATGRLTLERSNDGHWLLTDASRARASRNGMGKLLLALTELSLNKFLTTAIATKALESGPLVQLSLHANREQRQESIRLQLGAECPGQPGSVVLLMQGSRSLSGCVDAATIPKLTVARAALADPTAFSFRMDEVERLEVTTQGRHWVLARKDAAFQLTTNAEGPVTLGAGNALLSGLVGLRGQPVGVCDFRQSPRRVELALRSFVVGDGEPSVERVRVGQMTRDGKLRLCRDDGVELLLLPEDAQRVEVEPALLRDPAILSLPYDAIAEIRLQTPTGRQVVRRNPDGELLLVEPKSQSSDAAAIETLGERLANLRAERWLPQSRADATQNRKRNAVVEFLVARTDDAASAPTNPTHHSLALSLDATEPTIGWLDADPVPFLLEPALAELLDGSLLDRSQLRLNEADQTVTLSLGTSQVQLQRKDAGWAVARSTPKGFDPTALITTLEQLRAIAVYDSAVRPPAQAAAAASGPVLHIEYASGTSPVVRPRLRFAIGARFRRRGQWVRQATVVVPRLTLILRDQELTKLFSLLQPLPD